MLSARSAWRALALVHLVLLAALLFQTWAQTRPVAIEHALKPGEKLRCVSYGPFHRRGQTPFDATLRISRAQIEADLGALSALTDCVRIYATDAGLDQVPAVARERGMKVLLGVWISFDQAKNAVALDHAIALANEYRDVVRALVVGNEVLLRRERTVDELRALLVSARVASAVPVTYADVWEFWLKNADLAEAVDFVTVHILPFWEDEPVDIENALAHVASVRANVMVAFPGKSILIGETGWPSAGRQREGARPSRRDQARYIREFVQRAHDEDWDYNLIEAIDQPWKRALEGTVGGHWGLLDADTLQAKFPFSGPLAERESLLAPLLGAGVGALLALAFLLTGAGAAAPLRLFAGTLVGATSGLIAVLHAEHARLAYASLMDWCALGVTALAALAAGAALMRWRGEALAPADLAWQRIRNDRHRARADELLSVLRGFLLFAAAVAALLLFISPRYRDFPTLLYLGPASIYGVLGWQRGSGFSRAECVCAVVIVICALARWFPEPANPQAIGWLLTSLALALPACVAVFRRRRS